MLIIRQETEADHAAVEALIAAAFADDPHSDQSEPQLVARLRRSEAFIPELSLVAEQDGRIVGHILVSIVHLVKGTQRTPVLSLAPVSVLPAFQRQGIGTALIEQAHLIGKKLGYAAVVLLGHADYYPRFGYQIAAQFGIRFPFEAPVENCMIKPLQAGALQRLSGQVAYPDAFF